MGGCLACLLLLAGCGAQPAKPKEGVSFTDANGAQVTVTSHERVVSLYGSFAQTWMLAGGALVGATSDALEERNLELGEDVQNIGTVKQPNLEAVFALEPDFVILSADIEAQAKLDAPLTQAGIVHAYFREDSLQEYLSMLKLFCSMTGREDRYQQYGTAVQRQIEQIVASVQGKPVPTVLLLRAYSSGVKAKTDDNLAGAILKDLGCDNIADREPSLLEELSLETIVAEDPDFIFVTTMGDEQKALDALAAGMQAQPAWQGLSAVQEGRYVVLPKDLFHYKPNNRWGESYAYLADILYP